MTRYYSYIDTTVGLGSTTVQGMLDEGNEYGVVPSIDIVARNITATGTFIGTLGNVENQFLGIVVTGPSTMSDINSSGVITATSFVGDGSGLTGLDSIWSQNGSDAYYSDGNVGIGISTITHPLHIAGVGTEKGMRFGDTLLFPFGTGGNASSPTFRSLVKNRNCIFRLIPHGTGKGQFEFFTTDYFEDTSAWDNFRIVADQALDYVSLNTLAGSAGTARNIVIETKQGPGDTTRNNPDQLFLHTNNRIGIGTNDPQQKLNVYSNPPTDTGGIIVQNVQWNLNQDKPYLTVGTKDWDGGTATWDNFGFQHRIKSNSGGTPRVTIDNHKGEIICFTNGGQVGIGTNETPSRLTVSQPSPTDGILATFNNATNAALEKAGIRLTQNESDQLRCDLVTTRKGANAGLDFSILLSDNTGTEQNRLHIKEGGQVGIGTDNPTSVLSVHGSGDATTSSVQPSEYTTYIRTDTAFLNIGSVGGRPCLQGSGTGTAYKLLLNPFNGEVGIGTDNPQYNLHVNGDTYIGGDLSFATGSTLSLSDGGTDPAIIVDGGGPNRIRFLDNGSTNLGIDLVFRTAANTLGFEKSTDTTQLWHTDCDTATTTFKGPVIVDSDNNEDGALRILNNTTDTNNDFYFALEIDQDLTGSQVATADREQGGIYMNIDSSNTGGDTNHEHRAYGMYIDLDVSGDADVAYGVYADSTVTPGIGTVSASYGVYGRAEDNGGAGNVGSLYGVYGLTHSDNSTSDTSHMYGGYFRTTNAVDSNTIGGASALTGEIEIVADTPDIYGTSYCVRALYDNNSTTQQTNTTYLFYGDYAGTKPTTAYGLFINDDVPSLFRGDIQIGTATNDINITLDRDGDANFEGTVTAVAFVGDGSNLTGIQTTGTTGTNKVSFSPTINTNGTVTAHYQTLSDQVHIRIEIELDNGEYLNMAGIDPGTGTARSNIGIPTTFGTFQGLTVGTKIRAATTSYAPAISNCVFDNVVVKTDGSNNIMNCPNDDYTSSGTNTIVFEVIALLA